MQDGGHLVLLTVHAGTKDGQAASGLQRQDFRLLEGPQEMPLSVFAGPGDPLHVALVIDTSISTKMYLKPLRKAVQNFVDQFGPEDHLALYGGEVDYEQIVGFTQDRNRIKAAMGRLRTTYSGSRISAYSGAERVVNEGIHCTSPDFPEQALRRAVVVFSARSDPGTLARLDDLNRLLMRTNVPVYAVIQEGLSDGTVNNRLGGNWGIVLDQTGISPQNSIRQREAAAQLVRELAKSARVWLVEQREEKGKPITRLLVPEEWVRDKKPQPMNSRRARETLAEPHVWLGHDRHENDLLPLQIDYLAVFAPVDMDSPVDPTWFRALPNVPRVVKVIPPSVLADKAYRQTYLRAMAGGRPNEVLLSKIISDTGGTAIRVERPKFMGQAFLQLAEQIKGSYTLGYYTTGKGKLPLRVEMNGQGLVARTRLSVTIPD